MVSGSALRAAMTRSAEEPCNVPVMLRRRSRITRRMELMSNLPDRGLRSGDYLSRRTRRQINRQNRLDDPLPEGLWSARQFLFGTPFASLPPEGDSIWT